ncbi:MAG: hypothetical protein WBC91_19065 [Phototrophicaceae bacterium]
MRSLLSICWFGFIIVCLGCTPDLPNAANITPVTAIPTPSNPDLCAMGQDETQSWQTRLDSLTMIHDRAGQCEADIDLLLYVAYVNYGQVLEDDGTQSQAIEAYRSALQYFPDGTNARARLQRLESPNLSPTIERCDTSTPSGELDDYVPTDGSFVTFGRAGFQLNNAPFPIYGVTYYPSATPFELFLTETDLDDVAFELDLIESVGINTIRIFLRPDDLFICPAVVPHVENFERLDGILALAGEQDLRVIMVLNYDIVPSILYFEAYIQAQMQFIVARYQDEPTILAWDIRDQGDVDYRNGFVRQDIALRWLADAVISLRTIDTQHPITIGYWQDSTVVAPFIDFVSFQFYEDYDNLRQEIANLRASTNRPILLSGIGYSTFTVSDISQRNLLFQAFEEVANNGLMGWVVNHAFDYPRTVTCTPPDCPSEASDLNQYGLWNTGYFPKLAIEAVRITTGIDE